MQLQLFMMLTNNLSLVSFLELRRINYAKAKILIIYEHSFITSLVLAMRCPAYNIGYYSQLPNKLKFAEIFSVNIEHHLEPALLDYDYLIFEGLFYHLSGLTDL